MNLTDKRKWVNVVLWLLSVASMIGLMILGSRILVEDNGGLLVEFAVITIVSMLWLYLISGKKTFSFLTNQTGYTFRMLAPTLIFSAVFGLFGILEVFFEHPPLIPGWPVNLALFAADMFLVGVYEEACFRACACDALLPLLKNRRHPFLWTALISGLVFGYVHVVSADFSDLHQTLQFSLKIANTAVYGSMMMILYWKTRNLLGLAVIHGLNDFLPGFLDEIYQFTAADTSATYTSGDSGTTIVYLIQLAVELVCLFYIYRKVGRNLDYKTILKDW
ncbi:MAG: CPBP family intramembrane metalloprotease [Solobacterium sp.]|nr:CPBP family intramembrane metalloprotease [Solobacterium sp.]